MTQPIFLGLLQNTAILLALGMLYDYLWARDEKSQTLGYKLLAGTIIGGIGIILILTPWTLIPGLVFDTRSVMLSVAGLFFGPVPTVVAMAITGAYRLFLGGDGMWMGIAVILSSGTIGILWRIFRPGWRSGRYYVELLAMGFLVHLVMLACTLFLPGPMVLPTLKTISLPVLIIYPIGTMLLGALMIKRSEHWETRKALQRSEERWNYALEGAGDGVWDWNPQTGEVFYSPRWKEMLGYRDDEISNSIREWDDRVHPGDRDAAYHDLKRHVDGETEIYMNIHRLRCKDGSYTWILDRGKVMQRDDKGNPVRFIGTHTNINERKLVEEELTIAKSKAEESDRLKMSFLNNISHEVRTPLNAIMGFTTLLTETGSEEERARFGRIILSNSNQLLAIIDDVLEFSRLETEKVTLETRPFSISALLEDLYHSMKPAADGKNLNWNCKSYLDHSLDIMIGDQSRIRQVLTCFIGNALNYTFEGGIDLRVEQENSSIIFTVRDTGVGIDQKIRDKVFERFFRAPEAQKMATRGTGLGLSIAKHLVGIMGGTIGVNPAIPHGTEFWFRIPLVTGTVPLPADLHEERSVDLSGSHILIAEDEEDNFEYMQVLLSRKVGRISRVKNGIEAIEFLKRESPDLVLMDLKMPVMNGYEATREIRKTNGSIPIIALTAYSQPEEKKLAAEAGCTAFISKPIRKEKLMESIRSAIRMTR